MADPTQSLRDTISARLKSITPASSPLAMSGNQPLTPKALAEMEKEKILTQASPIQAMPTGQVNPADIVTRQPQPTQVAQLPSPAAMSTTDTQEPLINQAVGQQQSAADQALAATDLAMTDFEKQQIANEKEKESALSEVRKKIDENEKEVANFGWDNRSVWEKSSTGQKIALAIGGFLSSLNQNSAQSFRNSIERTMQNDLDQQKASYLSLREKGKGLDSYYGQLVQKYGSEQAADMAMMNAKIGMIQNKFRTIADSAQSKLVAANAMRGIEETEIHKQKSLMDLQKLYSEQAKTRVPGFQGSITDASSLKAMQERVASKDAALAQLNSLQSLMNKGAATPFSKDKKLAEQTMNALSADLAKAMFGRSSDAELQVARELLPDATSLFSRGSTNKALIDNLKKKLISDVNAAGKSYGLMPEGESIGRAK